MMPTLKEEKKLWKRGFLRVAGIDEAGRGPLAGPVVAAAVCIRYEKSKHSHILKNVGALLRAGVRDSKLLSERQREILYGQITSHPDILWGVGVVSEKAIDRVNILQATKMAMEKSVKDLNPDFLLLDGIMSLNVGIKQLDMIKGDQKIFSVAAASIIAKVARDRLMAKYHKKYPQYGFEQHKGYGTKAHRSAIKAHGYCPIHRKSFALSTA